MRSTLKGAVLGAIAIAVALPMCFNYTKSAYVASINNTVNTAATATFFTCNAAYQDRSSTILFSYPMTEASSATAANDASGKGNTGVYTGTMTSSTDARPACPRDSALSFYLLNGTTSYLSSSNKVAAPASFAAEVWFKSTSSTGGQILGFGSSQTGASTKHDRQIFLTNAGNIGFFVNPGTSATITSPLAGYNNGKWHHVIGQMSSTAGMSLFVDGALVATNGTTKTGATGTGYWRFGYDALTGVTGAPTSNFLAGSLRYGTVFSTVLTNTQVSADYRAGT